MWEAIKILEYQCQLKVLFVTCDGASANRKFFKLHPVTDQDPTIPKYWYWNKYSFLQGHAKGTAEWCTNVANEHGQVLMSVLTAHEGTGLNPMEKGLVGRYKEAKEPPPEVLYVDRDRCSSATTKMFSEWPSMHIRLDIWHFMRRLVIVYQ